MREKRSCSGQLSAAIFFALRGIGSFILDMPPTRVTERTRQENENGTAGGWTCMAITLIIYLAIFMLLQNDLRYSYVQARCLVINSTIIEKPCCVLFESEPNFEARWLVQVRPNELDPTRYLGEVRHEFDRYYEAYDATITLYPVRFLFLVTDIIRFSAFCLGRFGTALICTHK